VAQGVVMIYDYTIVHHAGHGSMKQVSR
jgi:hypothetical protein